MKYFLSGLLVLLLGTHLSAYAAVKGEPVDYSAEGVTLKGYLAYDDNIKGKRPGVLVVHEWWGHNEYARKRARMLAELGYTALAVDMYGDGKSTGHPKEALKFMKAVLNNMETAKARFMAALNFLKQQETVNPDKVAAIGYCFGGGVVLTMARAGVDLDGVASFHGSLATDNPAKPGVVKAKVLVLHGNADTFIPPKQVKAFKEEMQNAKVDFEFIGYPEAFHAFTNPEADTFGKKFDMPLAYNEAADKDSWAKLQTFFKGIFE
ncbi:dienelactone hydrolase family protein [Beggiatoa sp. PS]|nr:dienelactone hydrolase family protein [Beggiatoa sp. PS]